MTVGSGVDVAAEVVGADVGSEVGPGVVAVGSGVTVNGSCKVSCCPSVGPFTEATTERDDGPKPAPEEEDKAKKELYILHHPALTTTSRFPARSVTVEQGEQCQPVTFIRSAGTKYEAKDIPDLQQGQTFRGVFMASD